MDDEKPFTHEELLSLALLKHDNGCIYIVEIKELFTGEEEKAMVAIGAYDEKRVFPKVRNLIASSAHLYHSLNSICRMLQPAIDLQEIYGAELERLGVKSNMPELMVNELTRIQNMGFVGLRVAVEGAVKVATEVEAERLTKKTI